MEILSYTNSKKISHEFTNFSQLDMTKLIREFVCEKFTNSANLCETKII